MLTKTLKDVTVPTNSVQTSEQNKVQRKSESNTNSNTTIEKENALFQKESAAHLSKGNKSGNGDVDVECMGKLNDLIYEYYLEIKSKFENSKQSDPNAAFNEVNSELNNYLGKDLELDGDCSCCGKIIGVKITDTVSPKFEQTLVPPATGFEDSDNFSKGLIVTTENPVVAGGNTFMINFMYNMQGICCF